MKVLNANKLALTCKYGVIIVDVIKPPTFHCGELLISEYDLRNLQLELANGNICYGDVQDLTIIDEYGVPVIFNEDGTLSSNHAGLSIMSDLVLGVVRKARNKHKAKVIE
jgi:hypothetical protein